MRRAALVLALLMVSPALAQQQPAHVNTPEEWDALTNSLRASRIAADDARDSLSAALAVAQRQIRALTEAARAAPEPTDHLAPTSTTPHPPH